MVRSVDLAAEFLGLELVLATVDPMLEHEVERERLGDSPIAQDGRGADCSTLTPSAARSLVCLQCSTAYGILSGGPNRQAARSGRILIQSPRSSLRLPIAGGYRAV